MTKFISGQEVVIPEPAEALPVEKNVPVPAYAGIAKVRTSVVNSTARNMEVGDSVLFDYNRNFPYCSNMERATGFKFTQRREGDKLRVWRIK